MTKLYLRLHDALFVCESKAEMLSAYRDLKDEIEAADEEEKTKLRALYKDHLEALEMRQRRNQ